MAINIPIVVAAVLASLLTFAPRANAQVAVVAGVARASIAFDPDAGSPEQTETRRRTGLTVGVSLLLPTSRISGWQIEALVIEKGAENLLRPDDAIRLTYLDIPVMLHLDVLRRRQNAIFLLAGPSFAFTLHTSYEADGVKQDIRDDVSPVDVGFHVGAGVEIGRTTFDARYIWGGRTVFHDGDVGGTFKNRTFTVMAGIRLGR